MAQASTYSPQLTRRQLFQIGSVAVSGFFLRPMLKPVNVFAKDKVNPRGTADCCIFINLAGGASQVDTFDIKEGRWTRPISTSGRSSPASGSLTVCSRCCRSN